MITAKTRAVVARLKPLLRQYQDCNDDQSCVSDLLTDLMHYCLSVNPRDNSNKLSFEDCLARAERHFAYETDRANAREMAREVKITA